MKIVIDHISMTATLARQYAAPAEGQFVLFQGSMQSLTSGNVFIGWGKSPVISEHLEDSTPVFHASIPSGSSYRAFKSKWIGWPVFPPALWTYARTTSSSKTVCYVSWNGATEVHSWRFYTSASKAGPFVSAGICPKSGFETNCTLPDYSSWVMAEGLATNGSSLRNSSIVATWSPGPALAALCSDMDCPSLPSPQVEDGNGIGERVEILQPEPDKEDVPFLVLDSQRLIQLLIGLAVVMVLCSVAIFCH